MRVFVDTEFTDFIECELISIGLVADDGREFYGECSDFSLDICSEFVRAAVLPMLERRPQSTFTRVGLGTALHEWLNGFSGFAERALCFDYGGDWELLCDLLDGPPDGWRALHVGQALDAAALEAFYRENGRRHHALTDARAMRFAMRDKFC